VDVPSTDLEVGSSWQQGLVDVDCDGDTDEWLGACPFGEELERLCGEGQVEPGTACYEVCPDVRADDPSDDGEP
jgi:hypothetical protein